MKRVILTEAKLKRLMVEMRFKKDGVFVSYLKSGYDRNSVKGITRREGTNKCYGGVWACPIDSENGWKNWCEMNNVRYIGNNEFTFKLKPNAKIYEINNENDLLKISTAFDNISLRFCINYPQLIKNGYDGIYIPIEMNGFIPNSSDVFLDIYGFDVDTLLLFNPEVIIPINEKTVEHNFQDDDRDYDD